MIASLICLVALCAAAVARAELNVKDGLRLSFDAAFSPQSLPRDKAVPVRVQIGGKIGMLDGSRPPQVRSVELAINRYGLIFNRGLPLCGSGQLEKTTAEVALERCRRALVGRGTLGVVIDLNSGSPIPVKGDVLAFNGRRDGRPVIYLHVHVSTPILETVVLTFRITRPPKGKFGTVFSARIPRIASDIGYVTNISLELGRTYSYRGVRRSFISARCAAPSGFPGAIFSFVKGSFDFSDGKRLSTTLVRDCTVR